MKVVRNPSPVLVPGPGLVPGLDPAIVPAPGLDRLAKTAQLKKTARVPIARPAVATKLIAISTLFISFWIKIVTSMIVDLLCIPLFSITGEF